MKKVADDLRKRLTLRSLLYYFLLTFFGVWRVFWLLQQLFGGISPWIFTVVYTALCTMLPLGYVLPRSAVTRGISVAGGHWLCFQFTFFFAAVIEWPLKIILVDLAHLLTARQYVFVSLPLFGILTLLTVYGMFNARRVRLTRYACGIEKPALAGKRYKIVQLSDLHLSAVNGLRAMEKVVARVNALSPDFVCITGDTFTESARDVFQIDRVADAFHSIKSRFGVYACLGNHDAGPDFPRMLDFFKRANIEVLVDEFIDFGDLVLLGRSDMGPVGMKWHRRMSVAECLRGADHGKAIVVMDHQPGDIENSEKAGVDLLLSGHTHGGQFFPAHMFIRRVFPHYYGCKRFGDMYAIVSAGTYTAVSLVRLGSRSEIVEIDLFGEEGEG